MRAETRWTIVVLVLVAAGVVALFAAARVPVEVGPAPSQTGPGTVAETPDDAEVAVLRRRAALEPCPSPTPDAPQASGTLAGITVPCLGAPVSVDLGTALAGRPALLNLWASWCAPCREEIPILAEYTSLPGAIPVIGVNVRDDPRAALSLLADLGVHYPSVTDPDRNLQTALEGPPVLPVSIIVLPNGSVQRITDPPVFRTVDEVRQAVAAFGVA